MQHFFLFCIMLITVSEALPRRFDGNQISTGTVNKISTLGPRSKQGNSNCISDSATSKNPFQSRKKTYHRFMNDQLYSSNGGAAFNYDDLKKRTVDLWRKDSGRKKFRKCHNVKAHSEKCLNSLGPFHSRFSQLVLPVENSRVEAQPSSRPVTDFDHLGNPPAVRTVAVNKSKRSAGNNTSEDEESIGGEKESKASPTGQPGSQSSKSEPTKAKEATDEKANSFLDLPSLSESYSLLNGLPSAIDIPRIPLKHPYDPKLYEGSSFQSGSLIFNEGKDDFYPKHEESQNSGRHSDVLKLKHMLEDVESMLKERGAAVSDAKTCLINATTPESIKEKIDKLAIPLLTEISEELAKQCKNAAPANNCTETNAAKKIQPERSDLGCSPDGLWSSSILGAEMNLTILPNLMLKVAVRSCKKNGLINKKWFVQGLTLSKYGGPLILAAVSPQKKQIASFVGQCKVCQSQDLIFGTWTISSSAPNCCDAWTAIETKMDVLRRKRKKGKF